MSLVSREPVVTVLEPVITAIDKVRVVELVGVLQQRDDFADIVIDG